MFRALSIDGGGMRGIYTAAYLDALEGAYSKRRTTTGGLDIGKGFQLIVGTSTGAIIGCALAAGTAPGRVMELYRQHGAAVFPKRLPFKFGWNLLWQLVTRPKYLAQGETALRDELERLFQTTTLLDIWNTRQIALAITAVNMNTYRSWVFKTPHDPNTNHRDDARTLVDVLVANSASAVNS
jgi:patatin-like phospholipase/acyl hydrolase